MTILERLHMPPCDKTRVPVKALEEQLEADSKNKKILEKHIASMYLVSLLNEQTVRIRSYKDDEYSFQAIYVFEIELKANNQMTDFTELVHSAFQESTLLIMHYKNVTYLSGAMKRINKLDNARTVIEDSIWAECSENAEMEDEDETNLRDYYKSIMRWLYRLKVLSITKIFPAKDGDYKDAIRKYELINAQINKLKEDYSTASMLNERMRIDDELFNAEKELELLKQSLSGGSVNG